MAGPDRKRIWCCGSASEIVACAFDYEADVIVSREIDTSLDVLGLACVDDVDRVSGAGTGVSGVGEAGVVAPVVGAYADRVFGVEGPGCGPEVGDDGTAGVVVVWVVWVAD